ncbi:MAG: hypothetical protein KAI89_00115 [Emcibacter sp.]|nr:hypothetical protein [Emcibacter sp.]
MYNILISKTDPYSFMGLIKANRLGGKLTSSVRGLINAGLASLFLIIAITRMAEASVEEVNYASLTTNCNPEACKMV